MNTVFAASIIFCSICVSFFIDLLSTQLLLELQKRPYLIRDMVRPLDKDRWIIVDEVQKCTRLLDEIHHLMENEGYSRFVLTGSSVRKIKRGEANLLAGRTITKNMYPFTSREIDFSLTSEVLLQYGSMPLPVW